VMEAITTPSTIMSVSLAPMEYVTTHKQLLYMEKEELAHYLVQVGTACHKLSSIGMRC